MSKLYVFRTFNHMVRYTNLFVRHNMSTRAKICSENLKDIFLKSVNSVQPSTLIKNTITVTPRHLCVGSDTFTLTNSCYMVGFGKAVLGMAIEMEKLLGNNLKRAIVTVPAGIFQTFPHAVHNSKIEFIEGAPGNLPDVEAEEGARMIKDLAETLGKTDLLIVLISGGGSALLPLPKPHVTLEEKLWIIRKLSQAGANIKELNCVRKQLSQLKGGGLAQVAYPCQVLSLILSDVIGDPIDFIASGPTVPNQETNADAIQILRRYGAYDEAPASIKFLLQKENQFGKSDAPSVHGNYVHVSNYVIGNNRMAACAARDYVKEKYKFQCIVLSVEVDGDVNNVSKNYARLAFHVTSVMNRVHTEIDLVNFLTGLPFKLVDNFADDVKKLDFSKGVCFILAGEPTVVVAGNGRGGRNQQLALAISMELNKLGISGADISFLSGGTDGIDGPTDAAGAIGTASLIEDCASQNINCQQYLDNNDSNTFYKRVNDGRYLIKVGHTGTNVMDLHILIVMPQ